MPEIVRSNIEINGELVTLLYNQRLLLDVINQIKELSEYCIAIEENA